MESHFKFSDKEFEQLFMDCQLPPSIFNHEAHLRLAWIHIHQYGKMQAEKNIQEQLKNFVAFLGAKDKYNTTVTVAAIKAVAHFYGQSKTDNFKDFILEHPQLKNNFRDLIARHYSFDIFKSNEAKSHYLEPDLIPFG